MFLDAVDFLIEFINARPFSLEQLEAFYKRTGFSHGDVVCEGEKVPGDSFVLTDYAAGYSFRTHSNKGPKRCGDVILFSREVFVEESISSEIKMRMHEYRDFVDDCITGNVDIQFINKCCARMGRRYVVQFQAGKDVWSPVGSMLSYGLNYSLFDALESSMVKPFLSGNAVVYSKIKRCLNCGKYFSFKSQKGKFCGVKCRVAYHLGVSSDGEA